MGTTVHGNEFFDRWLDKKNAEVQDKMINQQALDHDDMLVLTIKGQTNHFHHMDIEFRGEFKKINTRFEQIDTRFEQMQEYSEKRFGQLSEQFCKQFEQIDKRFDQVNNRFEEIYSLFSQRFEQNDKRLEQIDKRFEQNDKRFQNQTTILIWAFGLMMTLTAGLYLK